MTSYFSSLLTTTTNRVASIRQNLLPSENDGDTEDDTHLCRVLRAYYTEKGRSFPSWLPPDPKAPPPVVVQPVYTTPGVGSRYGGGLQTQNSTSGLSSLWDSQPPGGGGQVAPDSLRRGRGAPAGAARLGGSSAPASQNPFQRPQETVQARPLPSQRAGSYQSASSGAFGRVESPQPPSSSSGGLSAGDRLRDRLRGGARSASPQLGAGSTTVQRNNSAGSVGTGAGMYDSRYEDSFMPTGRSAGGGDDKPFVSATSPWASNQTEFSGGGYGGGGSRQAVPARTGLPSGPGAARRVGGLPSGPRGMM